MHLITRNKIFNLILLLFFSINLNAFSIPDNLFNNKVLPILENNCFKCHGADKKKSGLRIDLRQNLLKGGDSGLPSIIPGDWSKSYLMEVVTHKDKEMAMPPKGEKLSDQNIEILKQWVNSGAFWPGQMDQIDDNEIQLWSFKPIQRKEVPSGNSSDPNSNPIDLFLRLKQKEKKLKINGPADQRTLIKRASIVLTGLMPSAEEVSDFINESSEDSNVAYTNLLNRLLESPHFGERWAQHWLDSIRWAESNGSESNLYRKNSWIYRDYVIDAINNDVPYNIFIRDQIAGDQYGAGEATGFLVSGPHVPAATIGQEPSAIRQARADRVDEIMQTVGASIIGVTVSCARCHNHKFDPVSIKDYYAMSAVFQGVEFGGRVPEFKSDHPKKIKVEEINNDITEQRIKLINGLGFWEENWGGYTEMHFEETLTNSIRIDFDWSSISIDELEVFGPDNKTNFALSKNGVTLKSDDRMTQPRGEIFKVNDGEYGTQAWRSKSHNKSKPWLEIDFNKNVNVNRIRLSKNREYYFETDFITQVTNDKFPSFEVSTLLKDGSWKLIASSNKYRDVINNNPNLLKASESLKQSIKLLTENGNNHSFIGRFIDPSPTYVLLRGSPENPRDLVEPSGFEIINGDLKINSESPEYVRRKAFAKWLTSSDHPLTSRVMVNRIWYHVFGTGIVPTTSDFGNAGAKPSHPELLDWLAAEFISPEDTNIKAWSIKEMIRLMMTTEAFKRSSTPNKMNSEIDANSSFLWRYVPKRVTAEVIRDGILLSSGKLDRRVGGQSYRIHNVKKTYAQWEVVDNYSKDTWRRMIYQERMRRVDDNMFSVFDFPDCGQIRAQRSISTTPLQALNLMNSEFVIQQSELIAQRAIKEAGESDNEIIKRIFQLILGRNPEADELSYCIHLDPKIVARSLINSNEFAFLP